MRKRVWALLAELLARSGATAVAFSITFTFSIAFTIAFAIAFTVSARAQGATALMASYPAPSRTGRAFITQYGAASNWGEGLATAKDSSGRLYVVGTVDFGDFDPTVGFTAGSDFQWHIARYTSDLRLDSTWGSAGIVRIGFGNNDSEATSIVIDSQGRAIVGGIDYSVTPTRVFRVARFNTDGSLDATFGDYGITTLATATSFYSAKCLLAFQSTGKIIVVGEDNRDELHRYAKLWRLHTNGNVDITWGTSAADPTATYDYNLLDTQPFAVAIDSSNRVMVSGTTRLDASHDLAYIARWTADGDPDSAWGSDTGGGQYAATLDGPAALEATFMSILIESGTSKIVGVGYANIDASTYGVLVARFSTAGVLDATFGASSGYTLADYNLLGRDFAESATYDASGRIVGIGQQMDASGNYYTPITKFALYRFTAEGAIDTTYSTDGVSLPVPNGDNGNDSVFYGSGSFVVVNADSSLVLPGHVNSDTGTSVGCAVKVDTNGSVDTTVGDHLVPATVTTPTVVTSAATSVGQTGATLNGTVNAPLNASTLYQFEYGLDADVYTYRTTPTTVVSSGSAESVSAVVTGLLSGYTYHYRLVATARIGDAAAVGYGTDTTVATTAGATNIIFSDTFTDTDATTLAAHTPDVNMTGGGFWRDRDGSGSITGNQVVGTGDYYATVTTGVIECTVSADFVWNGVGGRQPSILLRYQDLSNYWIVYLDGTNFRIGERIGGATTTRATALQSMSASTTYTISVTVSGTNITATVNGGNEISYGSMSSLSSNQNAGFEIWQSGITIDNFEVTVP